jgi:hypothetical protein
VILGTVVLTAGIAVAILALTAAVLVAIARLLPRVDRERRAEDEPHFEEPEWWPDFERRFADYLSSRD